MWSAFEDVDGMAAEAFARPECRCSRHGRTGLDQDAFYANGKEVLRSNDTLGNIRRPTGTKKPIHGTGDVSRRIGKSRIFLRPAKHLLPAASRFYREPELDGANSPSPHTIDMTSYRLQGGRARGGKR